MEFPFFHLNVCSQQEIIIPGHVGYQTFTSLKLVFVMERLRMSSDYHRVAQTPWLRDSGSSSRLGLPTLGRRGLVVKALDFHAGGRGFDSLSGQAAQ